MSIIMKKIIRKIEEMWLRNFLRARWLIYSYIPKWKGTTENKYPEEIIVSLTSFPARIKTVKETVKTLLMQKQKPNRIILWLAVEQFPQKERNLPIALLRMRRNGLEIKWCEDIRSYKKLIPTLALYPKAVIVTADDDIYYRRDWLKVLYEGYLRHTDMICAHRVTKFYLESDSFRTSAGGYDIWQQATYLHKLTGAGGVLYPPDVLDKDVLNKEIFMDKCPTNDDIWFWFMAVLHGTKIYVPPKANPGLIYVHGTQKGPTLSSINDKGDMLFWKDFYSMLSLYPVVDKMFREEYKRLICQGEINAEKSNL